MSSERLIKLLSLLHQFYTMKNPLDVSEENYSQIYQDILKNPQKYDDLDMEELFLELTLFVTNPDEYYSCFQIFHYHSLDFSFLDNYNDNVKDFFITLINDNNKHQNIFLEGISFYFSFIKTVDDLSQVIDCIIKNSLVIPREFSFEEGKLKNYIKQFKYKKYDLISKNFNNSSKIVKLIFRFNDKTERHEINSLFLTDDYFKNSFEIQDKYNFLLEFEHIDNFSEQVVKYLSTGELDTNLSDELVTFISFFAEMFCMNDLTKICNILLTKSIEPKYSFFRQERKTFPTKYGIFSYIIVNENFIIFNEHGYYLTEISKLSEKRFEQMFDDGLQYFPTVNKIQLLSKAGIEFSRDFITYFIENNRP